MSADKDKNSDPTYFQQWYVENGEDLNQSRRDRYKNDPVYREKILAQNREARKKRSDEKRKKKRETRQATKTNQTTPYKAVVREMTDKKTGKKVRTHMYTIGAVAKALGCSVQAIRMWEKKEVIKGPSLLEKKGVRLYTEARIAEIRKTLLKAGRLTKTSRGATKTVGAVKNSQYADRKVKFPGVKKPKKIRLYKIGSLATAVGRTVVTLEQLEHRELLPATPFRASKVGYRLYTKEMMEVVKGAFDERGGEVRGDLAWAEFYDDVFEAWTKLNVIGARIIE
jgi:DNA-binding transcriptional MerR regulator